MTVESTKEPPKTAPHSMSRGFQGRRRFGGSGVTAGEAAALARGGRIRPRTCMAREVTHA